MRLCPAPPQSGLNPGCDPLLLQHHQLILKYIQKLRADQTILLTEQPLPKYFGTRVPKIHQWLPIVV